MTLLAIVDGSTVLAYPASQAQCSAHAGRAIGPKALAERDLSAYGIVRVTEAAKPAITESQRVVEVEPAEVGGVWTQQWSIVDLDAGEQAAKLARAREEIKVIASDVTREFSAVQQQAMAEVAAAQSDGAPSAAKYPVVYGHAAGAGIAIGAAVTVVKSWNVRLGEIAKAQAAANKELDDNGLAGIPAARAIMDAL